MAICLANVHCTTSFCADSYLIVLFRLFFRKDKTDTPLLNLPGRGMGKITAAFQILHAPVTHATDGDEMWPRRLSIFRCREDCAEASSGSPDSFNRHIVQLHLPHVLLMYSYMNSHVIC
jgi:hypothetical protein